MNITRKRVRTTGKNSCNKCRILLIEGRKVLAKMTARILEDALDCEVTIANTYQQAQEILAERGTNFFVTISELSLVDANNGEIIDLLTQYQQHIIAITEQFDPKAHSEVSAQGVIDYVLKESVYAYEYLVKLVGRLYLNQFVTVMVVDESTSTRQLTGRYLERQFLTVVYAKDGEQALEILHQQPDIKLMLVDAEIPVMDGLTFTARVREFRDQNSLAIVGISGDAMNDLSAQFLKHGASDFIFKPFSYDALTCRVNQNLSMLNYIEEASKAAYLDFLTGLPNRRHFFNRGECFVQHALKTKKHLAVAMMDIDFFKKVNDTYGHDGGDEVLKGIASIIQTTLAGQHVARLGGEEFGFILDTRNWAEVSALLGLLKQRIQALAVKFEDKTIHVTVSIGATRVLKENLDETLKIADAHLYQAKTTGRNKIVWDPPNPPEIKQSLAKLKTAPLY